MPSEEECPNCGGSFRPGRRACPHCGADAATGWLPAEEQEAAEVDLNFTALSDEDYEHFLESERLGGRGESPGRDRRRRPSRLIAAALYLFVAAALILAFLLRG
jgi:ribosomal protein L32